MNFGNVYKFSENFKQKSIFGNRKGPIPAQGFGLAAITACHGQ
jgi:hypothetical protein